MPIGVEFPEKDILVELHTFSYVMDVAQGAVILTT
jgi:hypothetical protein